MSLSRILVKNGALSDELRKSTATANAQKMNEQALDLTTNG